MCGFRLGKGYSHDTSLRREELNVFRVDIETQFDHLLIDILEETCAFWVICGRESCVYDRLGELTFSFEVVGREIDQYLKDFIFATIKIVSFSVYAMDQHLALEVDRLADTLIGIKLPHWLVSKECCIFFSSALLLWCH